MSPAHHDVLINRPIDEVFDFLADGTNNPRWQSFVSSTTPPPGGIEAGATIRQRVRHPLGFTVSADYRVTAYDPPCRLALEVTSGGPLRPTVTYDLAPAEGGGTRLRCTIAHRTTRLTRFAIPALALLHPLFAWEAAAVERARRLLESQDQAAA
jgi:uncharacterized protein YndB with AHSA1/START domain